VAVERNRESGERKMKVDEMRFPLLHRSEEMKCQGPKLFPDLSVEEAEDENVAKGQEKESSV